MSVFYSLTPKILLEIDYTQIQFNNNDFPIVKVTDENESAVILSNSASALDYTNNPENTVFVTTDEKGKSVLDKDTAYFYPNYSDNITVEDVPSVNLGLKYVAVRLHLLAGYSFQEILGLLFSVWVLGADGKKVYFLKQAFRKNQIDRYKYNEISKNFGEAYYDKYIEFYILDYNDYDTAGVNLNFIKSIVELGKNPVIFASISEISEIDYKSGYAKITENDTKSISFAPRDEFDLLTAYVSENDKGYLEYGAKWDGQSIENFIYRLNSVRGNAFYISHELEIFEQIGNALIEVDTITQIQTKDFDKLKRLRFIVSNSASGGVLVRYVVRLYDKNTGDSVIKEATISIMDISPYLEDIQKINIPQLDNPIKVYQKIVSENITITNSERALSKVIVPLYVNAFNVVVADGFVLRISQFDNIYEIKLFNKAENGTSIVHIEPAFRHKMIFSKNNGSNITIKEVVEPAKRKFGILTFKITAVEAKNIMANGIKTFSIVTENETATTKLTDGEVEYK